MRTKHFLGLLLILLSLPAEATYAAESDTDNPERSFSSFAQGNKATILAEIREEHPPISGPYQPGMRYTNAGRSDEPGPAPVPVPGPGPSEPVAPWLKFGVVKD